MLSRNPGLPAREEEVRGSDRDPTETGTSTRKKERRQLIDKERTERIDS